MRVLAWLHRTASCTVVTRDAITPAHLECPVMQTPLVSLYSVSEVIRDARARATDDAAAFTAIEAEVQRLVERVS